MRSIMLALLALAACGGPPPRHRAFGTVVHERLADDDRAGWATELQIVRSDAVLTAASRRLGEQGAPMTIEALRRAVVVRRIEASRIIEIAVQLDDRQRAIAACSATMTSFVEQARVAAMAQDALAPARTNDRRILDGCRYE